MDGSWAGEILTPEPKAGDAVLFYQGAVTVTYITTQVWLYLYGLAHGYLRMHAVLFCLTRRHGVCSRYTRAQIRDQAHPEERRALQVC